MRTLITLTFALFIFHSTTAQVITVLRNGQSFFHYDANELAALVSTTSPAHTLAGDTIILPGGTLTTANFVVGKPLTFIGAGTIQAGTQVTGPTVLVNVPPGGLGIQPQLSIGSGAAGGSFHGVSFQSPVRFIDFGMNTPDFNFTFVRCQFSSLFNISGPMNQFSQFPPPASNITAKHCVFTSGINNTSIAAPVNFQAINSFIAGSINLTGINVATSTNVSQCILLGTGTHSVNAGVTFSNNIFVRNTGGYDFPNSNASFYNNLFGTSAGTPPTFGANAFESGNQATAISIIFQNVADFNVFNQNYNYQLATGSPAIGIGQGGYNAGVYGGPPGNPWKPNAIPFNPHWVGLTPAGGNLGTTNGGIINVTIQGAAQQN